MKIIPDCRSPKFRITICISSFSSFSITSVMVFRKGMTPSNFIKEKFRSLRWNVTSKNYAGARIMLDSKMVFIVRRRSHVDKFVHGQIRNHMICYLAKLRNWHRPKTWEPEDPTLQIRFRVRFFSNWKEQDFFLQNLNEITPPIAEIISVKNGRAIVVCGFLMR